MRPFERCVVILEEKLGGAALAASHGVERSSQSDGAQPRCEARFVPECHERWISAKPRVLNHILCVTGRSSEHPRNKLKKVRSVTPKQFPERRLSTANCGRDERSIGRARSNTARNIRLWRIREGQGRCHQQVSRTQLEKGWPTTRSERLEPAMRFKFSGRGCRVLRRRATPSGWTCVG